MNLFWQISRVVELSNYSFESFYMLLMLYVCLITNGLSLRLRISPLFAFLGISARDLHASSKLKFIPILLMRIDLCRVYWRWILANIRSFIARRKICEYRCKFVNCWVEIAGFYLIVVNIEGQGRLPGRPSQSDENCRLMVSISIVCSVHVLQKFFQKNEDQRRSLLLLGSKIEELWDV